MRFPNRSAFPGQGDGLRIRTRRRREDLFLKLAHFTAGSAPQDHHVALLTVFETLEVASRADLKVDLVQELERQRQILMSFRNNPDISEAALSGALYEIEQASACLLYTSPSPRAS